MTRNDIALEIVRLVNFLEYNQLVQANAITAKLENVYRQMITSELEEILGRPANWAHEPIVEVPGQESQEPLKNEQGRTQGEVNIPQNQCEQGRTPEPTNFGEPQQGFKVATGLKVLKEPQENEETDDVELANSESTLEEHKYWKAFRCITRTKQFILAGTTKKALRTVHELTELI